jgi:hypothetical protein
MDACKEISSGFFVAGGDGSELLESIEETFDEIAFGVEREVAWAADPAVGLGWDHRRDGAHAQSFDEVVDVVTLVGDQGLRLDFGEQRFGLGDVVDLSPVSRIASGLPSASTMAWILVVNPPRDRPTACSPPFFWARPRYADGRAQSLRRSWHIRCPDRPPRL